MKLPISSADIANLRAKVIQEKGQGIEHIRGKRDEKKEQMTKLLAQPWEVWMVKVHKVWKNLNLRKALFLRDEEDVKVVQDSGVLWMDIAENANKVIKYDFTDMDMRDDKEQLITDDAMFGMGIVMIDWYDEIEQQPIRTVVNPLTSYGDPRAWNTSKMRYFGTEVMKNSYELEESEAYFNINKVHQEYSQAIEDFERARNTANKTLVFSAEQITAYKDKWLIAVTNHITSFNGKLYLTTWSASCETLIRCIEIRDLTNKERRRPDKIDLWVTIYRAKPIPYSWFGASLFDEIEQFQDLATMLANLQVKLAQRQSLGANKIIDSRAGFDIDLIQNSPIAGQTFEATPDIGVDMPLSQMIYQEPKEQATQFPLQVMQMNDTWADETLGYPQSQVFGVSQTGSQTKAEVQTLQQNINEQLGLIADNYLNASKQYWKDHMICYASNMSKTDKKKITLFDFENQDSYTFKKEDFVPDGKITIYITSKVQEDIRDEKDFARISVLYGNVIQNLKAGSARFNEFARKYIDKSGVKGLKGEDVFYYNKDEKKAMKLINLINREEYEKDLLIPEATDDLDYIIEKLDLAIDNEYRAEAIRVYENFRDKLEAIKPPEMEQMAQGNAQSTAMASNMLASKDNSNITPSLWQVIA